MLIILFLFSLALSVLSIITVIVIINIVSLGVVKVPSIQTGKEQYPQILSLIKPDQNTKLYDLGCSWGDFLLAAAKAGAGECVGFEIALLPYVSASLRAMLSGRKISIRWQDFFRADLSAATAVYVYLVPTMMPKIERLMAQLTPGTIVVIKGKPLANRSAIDRIIFNEANGYGLYKYLI